MLFCCKKQRKVLQHRYYYHLSLLFERTNVKIPHNKIIIPSIQIIVGRRLPTFPTTNTDDAPLSPPNIKDHVCVINNLTAYKMIHIPIRNVSPPIIIFLNAFCKLCLSKLIFLSRFCYKAS